MTLTEVSTGLIYVGVGPVQCYLVHESKLQSLDNFWSCGTLYINLGGHDYVFTAVFIIIFLLLLMSLVTGMFPQCTVTECVRACVHAWLCAAVRLYVGV